MPIKGAKQKPAINTKTNKYPHSVAIKVPATTRIAQRNSVIIVFEIGVIILLVSHLKGINLFYRMVIDHFSIEGWLINPHKV